MYISIIIILTRKNDQNEKIAAGGQSQNWEKQEAQKAKAEAQAI